ncbi:MAG TPA: class I SAM-dependent methyltransferase [Acidimicrobiales bacterium]
MSSSDPVPKLSIEDIYGYPEESLEQLDALMDTSLQPRGPDVLYDFVGKLGLGPGARVLDLGCRDGRQLLELNRRFGCVGVGLEPLAANLNRAPESLRLVRAVGEAMPCASGSFDLVWVRDVLVHVEPLVEAFAECRRVLRPGGAVLVFQMFATDWLDQREADRLWPPLSVVPQNTDREYFDEAIAAAGLRIELRDELASEWREHNEEQDDDGRSPRERRLTSRQLLWAARLLRQPTLYKQAWGNSLYALELSGTLWGIYQMLGKLSPALYLLRA